MKYENRIYYTGRYKYRLEAPVRIYLEKIFPDADIKTEYYEFTRWGRLVIFEGYSWDGPSGPTIDTNNFMRGSLVHDVLYQMMRHRQLSPKWAQRADEILREICREDGMNWFRALYVYWGVRIASKWALSASRKREILSAP